MQCRCTLRRVRLAWSLSLLALLTHACGSESSSGLRYGPAELDHTAVGVIDAKSEILFESDTLALPSDIAVVGDNVVVIDNANEPAVFVVDRTSGEVLRAIGRRGDGPGEFRQPWTLDAVSGSTSEVWVYDLALGRLTKLDVTTSEDSADSKIVTLQSNGAATGPIWTDANTIVSLGLFATGRLAVFNVDGERMDTFGTVPLGPPNVPATVKQHAYQATLVPHPERHLLAAVTRHASRIELYRSDGSTVAMLDGPLPFEPRYSVRSTADVPVLKTGDDLRFGYIDGAGTNKYLFALFSGRTREGFPGRANFARFVHVFNWNGTFVKALRLDHDVLSIAVDRESTTLYAVTHDPTPAILRYALSDLVP